MNRDAFEVGFTLDEFTAEVNRGSKVQFISQQTEPFWRRGHTSDQARAELLDLVDAGQLKFAEVD